MSAGAAQAGGDDLLAAFDGARPRLRGLAYRMLGSLTDADDVVQDAWLRWEGADRAAVRDAEAWLTTTTTRIALDRLRADRRRREAYVGPWLPEPLVPGVQPDEAAELAESLALGFLTLLEELAPLERAVLVLAEVYAVPYGEIGQVVGRSPAACRQIASRARRRLRASPAPGAAARAPGARAPGARTPDGRVARRRVVDALLVSIAAGDMEAVVGGLAPGVVCTSDGGATRRAARRPVVGPRRVARLLVNLAARSYAEASVVAAEVNGDAGVVISIGGAVDSVVAFEVSGAEVAAIRIMRNPQKLTHLPDGTGAIL